MKPATSKISEELRANTDFGYAAKLSDFGRRLAVFYEYWRESAEHKEIVIACREAGAFKVGYKGGGVRAELMKKTALRPDIFPIHLLMVLTNCDGFPDTPFCKSDLKSSNVAFPVAMRRLTAFSWENFLTFRDVMKKQGLGELKFFKEQFRGETCHPISIPWSYTNAELAAMFIDLLQSLRPPEFPEPKNPGRKGRSAVSGVSHLLKQLGAFRLKRAGLDYYEAGGKEHYASSSAWNRAIHTAKERISSMTKRPLLGLESL